MRTNELVLQCQQTIPQLLQWHVTQSKSKSYVLFWQQHCCHAILKRDSSVRFHNGALLSMLVLLCLHKFSFTVVVTALCSMQQLGSPIQYLASHQRAKFVQLMLSVAPEETSRMSLAYIIVASFNE